MTTSVGVTFSVASAAEEPPSRLSVAADRDEHVDDLTMLVNRAVDVPPDAVDLDVGLVDMPPVAWSLAGEPGGVGEQWGKPLYPPIHGDVIDLHAAFDQEFLNVAIGQVEAQMPAHRDDGHRRREPEAAERRLRWQPPARADR